MTQLHILNVAYPFARVSEDAVGGCEQMVFALDRALVAAGHDSYVLAASGSQLAGTLCASELPEGPFDVPMQRALRAAYAARLARAIAVHRPQLVHLHGVDYASYLPPQSCAVPIIVTLHLPLDHYDPAELASSGERVAFVAVSNSQIARPGARRARVIENGVALERFAPSDTKDDYFLILARICPEKGVHLALEAARRCDARLLIAGEVFPYREHVAYFHEQVEPLLDARRVFLGPVGMPRKAQLLARARALLVPSLVDETSSLVSMEALACGTPVVGFRRGALPEIVEHGRTGLLVGDLEELVGALPQVAACSPRDCRCAAEQRFDLARTCAQYERLYREYIDQRLRGVAPVAASALSLEELNRLEQLEGLRDEWLALYSRAQGATFFQRPEWLLSWCKQLRGDMPLHVAALRRRGELVGLAPFFRYPEGETQVLALAGAGVSDYQDVLVATEERREVLAALSDWIGDRTQPWQRCQWSELPEGSALRSLQVPGFVTDRVDAQEPCLAVVLPERESELLARTSRHIHQELPRMRRRALRDGFRFEIGDRDTWSEMFEALMLQNRARRHERVESDAFLTPQFVAFQREAASEFQRAGMLRLYGMRKDAAWAGVLLSFQDRDRLHVYLSGFDSSYGHYSPGSLLLGFALERAVAEGDAVCDLLRGGEAYKLRWGARPFMQLQRRVLVRDKSAA